MSLVAIMIISSTMFAFADSDIDRSVIKEQVLKEYEQLNEFQMHYAEYPTEALAMIDRITDSRMKLAYHIMPSNGNTAYIDFPMFKQKNGYYCGPSSALTAIYGKGRESKVSGSNYDAKQTTLASAMGTSSSTGTVVNRVTSVLNKYMDNYYSYHYEPSKNDIAMLSLYGLSAEYAPIMHARTDALDYYNGYSTGHYIPIIFVSVDSNNLDNTSLAVMDNNRNDDYYGTHDITLREASNCMKGRYLIQ